MNPPRLELATLAYEELASRGENRARAAQRLFPGHLPPIPWLTAARQEVLAELDPSTTPRANGRLYVILRSGYSEMSGYYGAYVGVTSHRVEERFRQHLTGIRAASGLEKHGIELLYSLFPGPIRYQEGRTSGEFVKQIFTIFSRDDQSPKSLETDFTRAIKRMACRRSTICLQGQPPMPASDFEEPHEQASSHAPGLEAALRHT